MEDRRRKFSTKKVMGCAVLPLVVILLLCFGPRACNYFHEMKVKNEFRAHRDYYESLVRQIESEKIPPDQTVFYVLPKDRYSGTLKKYVHGEGEESSFDALLEGRAVHVETWNGVLTVKIGLRRTWGLFFDLPAECGVAYCAGDSPNVGAEESMERFENRWWLLWRSLAH